ncbi:MAG: hypothetical protein R3356_00980 [Eudoraea sp.]|nr:hypothetical protein [Eudoraea sp.]
MRLVDWSMNPQAISRPGSRIDILEFRQLNFLKSATLIQGCIRRHGLLNQH